MHAETTSPDAGASDERLRRDLQRLHRAMGTATILRRAIDRLGLAQQPRRVLALGAGDASLLLRVARSATPVWRGVELTLLGREPDVAEPTRKACAALGWTIRCEPLDAVDWAMGAHPGGYDLCLAVLLLHRLDRETRSRLLPAIARRTLAFVACEPQRGAAARVGSRLVAWIGAGPSMREHAVRGSATGFAGRELAVDWPPAPGAWATEEYPAGLFLHCFTAIRVAARVRERAVATAGRTREAR